MVFPKKRSSAVESTVVFRLEVHYIVNESIPIDQYVHLETVGTRLGQYGNSALLEPYFQNFHSARR